MPAADPLSLPFSFCVQYCSHKVMTVVLATLPTLNLPSLRLQNGIKCLITFVHKHKQIIRPPRLHNDKFHLQMFL